ncbi:TIGR04283 family arsenosugar biosynthesis glycosyltransferase [Hymenobacter psychrophilus]|uniref:Transferase 2, rSAM/selenodomain-associated n=1 Tax=Hymenobacter psychrophilus TaxID=651662 RepID=A0A1H3L9U3_9BACT|nr:TIGR04283 family arsenosugar biosynthesis glycosyltransferase [Hymenobacter psychrophilus]SDY60724.1 transferase 2, rSAM/selenodomain-associated [Hymenobacter psychrophilus]
MLPAVPQTMLLPGSPPCLGAAEIGLGTVSIIIPAYNEAAGIGALLAYLRQATADEPDLEIIVVDGGSTDGTRARARRAGATVVRSPRKGRAAQLNYGARQAGGDILYFLHADSYPPPGFVADLRHARRQGCGSGCYRLAFDHGHWFLRFSAWCTRLPLLLVRFGDQSLFVQRDVFAGIGGFREDLLVMEDQEIVRRLQAHGPFRVLPRAVTTSARKYLDNGVFRLQAAFTLIAGLYWLGVSQPRLVRLYRQLIRQDKL